MHRRLLAVIVLLAWSFSPLHAAEPTADQLREWIAQLGAPTLSARSAATEKLWQAGEKAVPALTEAQTNRDLEVATRARYVLERIRSGVLPNTDPEVAQAIEQLRFGDAAAKRAAFQTLFGKREFERLGKLIDDLSDAKLRDEFNQSLVGDLVHQAIDKIGMEDGTGAVKLLEEVHRRGGSHHLATYLHLTGQAPERMKQLQGQTLANDSVDRTLLWYLQRLEGDMKGAKTSGDVVNRQPWQYAIAHQTYDWPFLINIHGRSTPPANADISTRIRFWGGMAIMRRAANQGKLFTEAQGKLLNLRDSAQGNAIEELARTLVLIDNVDDAEELLRGQRRVALAELLSHQGRYRDAFWALALNDPLKDALKWFEALDPDDHRVRVTDTAHPFHSGKLAARLLYNLGEHESALALFERLGKIGGEDRAYILRELAKTEWLLGIGEQAERHTTEAIVAGQAGTVFGSLYTRLGVHAERWWNKLAQSDSDLSAVERMRLVRQLLNPLHQPRLTDEQWQKRIDGSLPTANNDDSNDAFDWYLTLAETAQLRRDYGRALKYLSLANETRSDNRAARLKAGDVCLSAGKFADGAKWYHEAWELDRRQPLPRWLEGYALGRAGEVEPGKKLTEQAQQMLLGDLALRHQLASDLKERGLRRAATEVFELEPKLSLFRDWNVYVAGQDVAQRDGGRDPAGSIEYWQAFTLRIVELGATLERDGTLRLPQNAHRLRARIAFQNKDYPAAVAELEQAQRLVQHDVDVVLGFLPQLLAAKQNDAVDRLFDSVYRTNAAICEQFPRAALHHNNLAWLAARSARRLDDALEHAELAVKLKPDYAGYLDTLAEVHFQRGNRDEALRLERRCLEQDPNNATFKKQLERFEKEKPGPVGEPSESE